MIDKHTLQTFIPINALASDRLEELVKTLDVEVLCVGQTLFEMGDQDDSTIYLLSGDVELTDAGGERRIVSAGSVDSWHPLEHHQPRRSTAVAYSDVNIVRVDSFRLDTLLTWDQSAGYAILDISSDRDLDDDAEWMIKLLSSNIFYKVPAENIQEIFRRLQPQIVKAGESIIKQGEEGDCFYIIKKGVADVSIKRPALKKEEKVAELEAGQFFGEEALLAETVRNANVTMKEGGVLMRLNRDDFNALLRTPVLSNITFANALGKVVQGAEWLDVRIQEEYEHGHLPGPNMPLNLLRLKAKLLQKEKPYIVYCDTGRRSSAAAYLLSNAGFEVYILEGGLNQLSNSQKEKHITDADCSYHLSQSKAS